MVCQNSVTPEPID